MPERPSPVNDVPLVSVLLPVLNPDPAMLGKAVKSILDQDYPELELVIVEDPGQRTGSEVVEGFADGRVRYTLNKERTSLREQLNLGVSLARGEFIARMDADDISRPERIRKQAAYLKDNPGITLVGSNLELIDGRDRTIGYRRFPESHDGIYRDLRLYCSVAHPAVMFRKSHVVEAGCYQVESPMEDWDLWCRMAIKGRRFHNIQEPLLKYRVHTQAGKFLSMRKTLLTGIELKERHFKGRPGEWGFREGFRCFVERLFMFMPPLLVLKLFLLSTVRDRP